MQRSNVFRQLIRASSRAGLSTKAWAVLAHCFAHCGDLRTARACAAHTAGDPHAAAKAWAAIAATSRAIAHLRRARRACRQLRDPFFRAKAYLAVFSACHSLVDLRAARASAQRVPDTYFRGKAYSDIARTTGDARDRAVAERCMNALGTGYLGRRLRTALGTHRPHRHGDHH